jgi:hypothetical protein
VFNSNDVVLEIGFGRIDRIAEDRAQEQHQGRQPMLDFPDVPEVFPLKGFSRRPK